MSRTIIMMVAVALVLVLTAGSAFCQSFQFVSSSPAQGSIVSNPSVEITLTFNLDVSPLPGSVTCTRTLPDSSTDTVDVSQRAGASPNELIISFPGGPQPDGLYTLNFGGLYSGTLHIPISGNSAVSFTIDATRPMVTATSPVDGATFVPLNSDISVSFAEAVDLGAGNPITVTGPSGSVPLTFVPAAPTHVSTTYTFHPTSPLASGVTYTVDSSMARDGAGNPATGTTAFSFTTVDIIPPTFISSQPSTGATGVAVDTTIQINFNEQVDVREGQTVTLTGPSGPVLLDILDSTSPNSLSFRPLETLQPNTHYTFNYAAVQDMAGNAVTGVPYFTFTTAGPLVSLVGSNPAAGQIGVSTSMPLLLTFDGFISSGSTAVLRSRAEIVPGTVWAMENQLTFTPTTPLRFGTAYTMDFSGVRSAAGQPVTGTTTLDFTTEVGDISGSVDPAEVRATAGQIVGLTYLIQNRTTRPITLTSSSAEFFAKGEYIGGADFPVTITVPAGGVASVQSNVTINEQIQNAAKTAGADEIDVIRTFTEPSLIRSRADGAAEVSIPVRVLVGSSLASAVSVTDVLLDVPADYKTVSQLAEIRGHAFIKGTGSGPISGIWFVDGQPVETFQLSMFGGMTQEVSTRISLPTQNLGAHKVQLKVTRPTQVDSNEQVYLVAAGETSSQRVFLANTYQMSLIQPGVIVADLQWTPMPAAAAYEIAVASDPSALGLNQQGLQSQALLQSLVWNQSAVSTGRLALLARVRSDVFSWTPSPAQVQKLSAMAPTTLYAAVRAVYAGQDHGDPTTTSLPMTIALRPRVASLPLTSPAKEAEVQPGQMQFTWQQAEQADASYEVELSRDGQPVMRALTRGTSYVIRPLQPFKLTPGRYSWRVLAMKTDAGVVAASEPQTFTVPGTPEKVRQAKTEHNPGTPIAQTTFLLTGNGTVGSLPGAVDQIAFVPANGAVTADQQPTITITYPPSKPETVVITLNGVDITSIASITDTTATIQAPGVFNEGQHTVGIAMETTTGEKLDSTSTFTIKLPLGTNAAAAAVEGAPPLNGKPLVVEWDWNWRGGGDSLGIGDLVVGLNIRGFRQWSATQTAYSTMNAQITKASKAQIDITNLISDTSIGRGKYKALIGDIGSDDSSLTTGGLTHRSFNFITNTGGLRMSASHTLGRLLQRSGIGRAPDMTLLTAENAGATPERGLKLTYVNSKDSISGGTGFVGPNSSRVMSLSGRTNLGKTGLKLRAEMSRSDSDFVTALGSQSNTGNAYYAVADGSYVGFNVSATYRQIASTYSSPASQTLTNDMKGWTYCVNRPFGKYLNAAVNYMTLGNGASSVAPSSSIISKSLDLTAAYPHLPLFTFRLARNSASSDPFVAGGRPGANAENMWSMTMNYSKPKWNAYLSYGKSRFNDFYDVIDPTVDTPNDRTSGTWAIGLGMQPSKNLRLRFDWGQSTVERWFRTFDGPVPLLGTDGSHQGRLALDYKFAPQLSSSLEWSRWTYGDALGAYRTFNKDLRLRMNYLLKVMPGGGGFVISAEWRKYELGGTQIGQKKGNLSLLINDTRLLNF